MVAAHNMPQLVRSGLSVLKNAEAGIDHNDESSLIVMIRKSANLRRQFAFLENNLVTLAIFVFGQLASLLG